MSLGTDLPSFSIPRVDCDILILLGSVGKTRWNLKPKFNDDLCLKYFDVLRTTNAGRVEFEMSLTLLVYEDEDEEVEDNQWLSGCLEEGQTTVRILTDCWKVEYFKRVKGCVTLYNDCMQCSKCGTRTLMKKLPVSLSNLSDDLLVLLNNWEAFADATLKCGTDEIPVHKNILVAKSPVFAAKFKNKMEDSREVVEITDIKSDVLKSILKFIYSGKVDSLTSEVAEDLLIAADNYQLQELKVLCAKELQLNTTVDNVSRMLVLGHLHEDSLKSHAKETAFKYYNFSDLENTEGWKVLEREYPRLAIEVMESIIEHKKSIIKSKS